jgi:outer membrane protein OmpA-like peptidoglycan-associated protein
MSSENDYLKKQLLDAQSEIECIRAELDRLAAEIKEKDARIAEMLAANKKLPILLAENRQHRNEIDALERKLAGLIHDKPPNIDLTDRANFKFESGSAEFTEAFSKAFNASPDLNRLAEIVRDYKVDVIEVIGHTDADWNPENKIVSNLDKRLGEAISALPGDISTLKDIEYGSNADLGLVRAIAVRQLIRKRLEDSNLAHDVQVRCYSAAQSVIPGVSAPSRSEYFKPNMPEADRRRIEIRFTRLAK